MCDSAQNPPDELSPFATEPSSMSIWVACPTCAEFTANQNMGDTYGQIIQFREAASSSTYGAKGDTLIEIQTIFILMLQLDLFIKVRPAFPRIT